MKRVANWNTLLAVVALMMMLVVGSGGAVSLAQDGQGDGEPELRGSGRRAAGPEPFLVKDIFPEALGRIPFSSSPNFLTNFDGTLFFSAIDRTTGDELWKSDGSEAGTVLVKDINPGVGDSLPSILTEVDGTLFLTANDDANGFELWKSDGTEAGTVLVKDIWPGMFGPIPASSAPANLTDVNGTLFFQCNDGIHGDELWKSDGTEAGTVLIKDINPGTIGPDPAGSAPENLTDVNGTLFFIANDGTNGYELWKSDGTEAGTVLVKDINPGASGSFPSNLIDVNGTLFFIAADGTNGYELWKSDGTAAGTVLIKDIYPGASGSFPSNLTNVRGTLFFSSNDGPTGKELWKSDGTEAGTVLVKDIYPGTVGPYPYSSSPNSLTDVDGTLFFIANDGPTGNELWKSDGTAAGTVLVKDIYPGPEGSRSVFLTDVDGTLAFRSDDGITGSEFWKSDGTEAGTVLVEDIWPGTIGPNPAGSAPGNLTDVNGTLFFRANDGTTGNELWAVSSLGDDSRPPPMTADDASVFTPMTPQRLVDTRIGYGTAKQRLQAGESVDIQVTGRLDIPSNATAVVANVIAVDADRPGYLQLLPTGQAAFRSSSTLNTDTPGQTIPNAAFAPLGDDGKLTVFAVFTTDVVIDVSGYFTPATTSRAGRLVPLTPTRILDTRISLGGTSQLQLGERVAANSTVTLQVAGRGGVPTSGVSAVVMNVIAVDPAGPGYVQVAPTPVVPRATSNLNTAAGRTIANLVVVPLSAAGTVDLFTITDTDLVADVVGYFTDNTAPESSKGLFVPITPNRQLDTRLPAPRSPVPEGTVTTIDINDISATAIAITGNLTATEATQPGYLQLAAPPLAIRTSSNLNISYAGQTIANAVVSPVAAGKVQLYNLFPTHELLDVTGWFTSVADAAR